MTKEEFDKLQEKFGSASCNSVYGGGNLQKKVKVGY